MAFKFRTYRNPLKSLNLPSFPSIDSGEDPEVLIGTVNGFSASAPEERLARAFDKAKIQYEFRLTVGAPRGLPGWKELDFVVMSKGLMYAVEVDTAFTHRQKEQQDVLHDAIIMNDPELRKMGEFWPHVIHVDGDSDLSEQKLAEQYVKYAFGQ